MARTVGFDPTDDGSIPSSSANIYRCVMHNNINVERRNNMKKTTQLKANCNSICHDYNVHRNRIMNLRGLGEVL